MQGESAFNGIEQFGLRRASLGYAHVLTRKLKKNATRIRIIHDEQLLCLTYKKTNKQKKTGSKPQELG